MKKTMKKIHEWTQAIWLIILLYVHVIKWFKVTVLLHIGESPLALKEINHTQLTIKRIDLIQPGKN